MKKIIIVLLLPLLAMLVLLIAGCDNIDKQAEKLPEILKRITIESVNTNYIWINIVTDNKTGKEYLVFHNGDGLVVVPVEDKKADK